MKDLDITYCYVIQAAYERMEEGKEGLLKFFQEMSRSIIQDAPENSFKFTKMEKEVILSTRFWEKLKINYD